MLSDALRCSAAKSARLVGMAAMFGGVRPDALRCPPMFGGMAAMFGGEVRESSSDGLKCLREVGEVVFRP